jgi:hypothetical protein
MNNRGHHASRDVMPLGFSSAGQNWIRAEAHGQGHGTGTPTLHRLEVDIAHPLNTAIHHVGVAGVCQHALDQETRFLSNTSW